MKRRIVKAPVYRCLGCGDKITNTISLCSECKRLRKRRFFITKIAV